MAAPKCWTMYPPESYSILRDGEMVGVGLSPLWQIVPGAWNLFAMSWPDLDELLHWRKSPDEFPVHLGLIGHAVGTALQMDENKRLIGDLAQALAPVEFLAEIKDVKHLILIKDFGEVWWEQAEKFAQNYVSIPAGSNVVPIGRGRRLAS